MQCTIKQIMTGEFDGLFPTACVQSDHIPIYKCLQKKLIFDGEFRLGLKRMVHQMQQHKCRSDSRPALNEGGFSLPCQIWVLTTDPIFNKPFRALRIPSDNDIAMNCICYLSFFFRRKNTHNIIIIIIIIIKR